MSERIQQSSKVKLRLTLTLSDGTLVEETGEEPDIITIGNDEIVPGLEKLLLGLTSGEKLDKNIPAEESPFGQHDEDNIQIIPLSEFDESINPEPGVIIEFSLPNGQTVPGIINQVDENIAIVDFNHPLSGRDLLFKAEIISIQNP